ARLKLAEVGMFDARVRPVHVHSDAGPNQDADHGIGSGLMKTRTDSHRNAFAARDGMNPFAARVEQLDFDNLAGPVAMPKTGRDAIFFLFAGLLLLQHQSDVAIDYIAGTAFRFDPPPIEQDRAI